MPAQLDLFTWASAPPPPPRRAATGHVTGHPCNCGRVHNLVYLAHPYSMFSLRPHRVSEPYAYFAEMMAERYAKANQPPPRLG